VTRSHNVYAFSVILKALHDFIRRYLSDGDLTLPDTKKHTLVFG